MRISARSNSGMIVVLRYRQYQRGFTLLEMMLVLVIVGVMVGLVALNLGGNPAREVDKEARRLQAVLTMASEEAITLGVELALAISNNEEQQFYQLLVLDPEELQWILPPEPLNQTDLFASHVFNSNIYWQLELEGAELDDRQLDQLSRVMSLNTEQGLRPAILLLSSGEMTPFKLQFNHLQSDYQVTLLSDGISGVVLQ